MKLSHSSTHFVLRSALHYPFKPLLRGWFPALCLTLAFGLSPGLASADNTGTIAFDVRTPPITATASGGSQANQNFTADMATPLTLNPSHYIDGNGSAATGYAVMRDPSSTVVRDFLRVTENFAGNRGPGMNIPYYNASVTLTKSNSPEGLDLTTFGLNADNITAAMNAATFINGNVQTINGSFIDSATNEAYALNGLTVTVQDNPVTPEPSSMLGIGLGTLMLAGCLRGRRKRI